jgi:hypothetical protein
MALLITSLLQHHLDKPTTNFDLRRKINQNSLNEKRAKKDQPVFRLEIIALFIKNGN